MSNIVQCLGQSETPSSAWTPAVQGAFSAVPPHSILNTELVALLSQQFSGLDLCHLPRPFSRPHPFLILLRVSTTLASLCLPLWLQPSLLRYWHETLSPSMGMLWCYPATVHSYHLTKNTTILIHVPFILVFFLLPWQLPPNTLFFVCVCCLPPAAGIYVS